MSYDDGVDTLDYRTLVTKVVMQGVQDYVSLAHPKARVKKFLNDAHLSSIYMLFDDTYRFEHFTNGYEDKCSLEDMLMVSTERENVDIDKFRKWVIERAKANMEKKDIVTVNIPDTLFIDGHVYEVIHDDESDHFSIDFEEKVIVMNKSVDNSDNQEHFVLAAFEITLYHQDTRMSAAARKNLAKTWFRVLRSNSCFRGA